MANSNIRNNTPVVTTGAGTVKWFNAAKGLGFVTSAADPHKHIMVHVNTVRTAGLAETLAVGHAVSFTASTVHGRTVITEIALA